MDEYGYIPGTNRLDETASLAFDYDPMGSTIGMEGTVAGARVYNPSLHLEYDAAGRTAAATRNGVRFEYDYDHQARRVMKRAQIDATASDFRTERILVHDLSGNILAELDGEGHTIAEYVYVGGERMMKVGLTPAEDIDEDGMTNVYEEKFNLAPFDATDAEEDPDHDFLTNVQEFGEGTDPYQADTDHDAWSDREEVLGGTDPLDPESYPGADGAVAIYEDRNCNKVFEPQGGDRSIETFIQGGPFTTADCVVIFTTGHLEADSVSITATRGITVWGEIQASDTEGTGISLDSGAWLDLSGATLESAAPSIVLEAEETVWVTGAHIEGPTLVTITTSGLLTGVNAQITANGSGSQIAITAAGQITLSRAILKADADVAVTSTGTNVVLASATLKAPDNGNTEVAVSADDGGGTIDIRGATINDDDPIYDGSLIGNGNPPSTAFPLFNPVQDLPATTNPKRVAVGDFNGDTYPDLALALTGDYLGEEPGSDLGSLLILLGDAQGKLKLFARFENTGRGPSDLVAADFNNDGKLDLALTRVGNVVAIPAGTDVGGLVIYLGDGTGNFIKRASYTSGKAPGALVAEDFTGDGKPDLAVAHSGVAIVFGPDGPTWANAVLQPTIEVFKGRGNGTFLRLGTYAVGVGPFDIDTGYVDNNGSLDLLVACVGDGIGGGQDTGHVAVLLNNSAGNFSFADPIDVGPNPISLRLLPLNPGTGAGEDSHLDLAVGRAFDENEVTTLTGDGTGDFTVTGNVSVPAEPWFLTTGDVVEDDKLDVVVVGAVNGNFSVLASNGDGTVANPVTTPDGLFPRSLGVADFNGDGHLDAAVVDDQADLVRVYAGRGDGTFQTPKTFMSQTSPIRVIHGHWDSNATVDLATLNVATGDIKVFLGADAETFNQTDTISTGTAVELASADFDEDGDADLAWAVTGTNAVKIALGDGDGTFQTPTTVTTTGLGTVLAYAGLFTHGDAQADLAVIGNDGTDFVFRLYPGNGDSTFGTPSAVTLDSGEVPTAVAWGDLDGDEQLDFAVTYESGLVRVLEGVDDTDLQLGTSMVITEGSFPRSVVVADLDGDNDLDIATANSGVVMGETGPEPEDADGRVSVFRNTGSGSFASDSPIMVGSYPLHVEAGDLNGDGYPDLSVVRLTDLSATSLTRVGIQVLISNAQGGFLGPEETLVGYVLFSHAIVDLDADGLNDAVVADGATSTVVVLRNYLNVAMNDRATPKRMFAKKGAPAKAPAPPVRLASLVATPIGHAASLATETDYAPYWYHNDHLGTPQTMTDETRQVVWKGYYRPFGEVFAPVEQVVNPFRFPGQYEDRESGKYYNWHRQYATDLGRYAQFDPWNYMLAFAQPALLAGNRPDNPYEYARSAPARLVDLAGLMGCRPPPIEDPDPPPPLPEPCRAWCDFSPQEGCAGLCREVCTNPLLTSSAVLCCHTLGIQCHVEDWDVDCYAAEMHCLDIVGTPQPVPIPPPAPPGGPPGGAGSGCAGCGK